MFKKMALAISAATPFMFDSMVVVAVILIWLLLATLAARFSK